MHTGSLSDAGTKSPGSLRTVYPPSRDSVSSDLPFRVTNGSRRDDRLAKVFIRRTLRCSGSGDNDWDRNLILDRIVRILWMIALRRPGPPIFSSNIVSDFVSVSCQSALFQFDGPLAVFLFLPFRYPL